MKQLETIKEILGMHVGGKVTAEDAIALISQATKSKGERAYELRKLGKSWHDIGVMTGDKNPCNAAKYYAIKNNRPWPPAKIYVHQSGSYRGEEIETIRASNPEMTLREIGTLLGISHQAVHQASAYLRAKQTLIKNS